MKLKLAKVTINGVEKEYAEITDGKPVYVGDDGKDIAFDAPHTSATIARLNSEAKSHRERAETAEKALKTFDGIEDAAAAIKAVETVKNLDEGKLLSAGKVEEIKAAARKAAEEQVAAVNKTSAEELAKAKLENEKLNAELDQNVIGGGFARSRLITDPKHPMALIMTANVAKAYFGKNFKREEGKVVGYDNNGSKLFSRAKPGELADMDEALELLVAQDPDKDQILRSSGNRGDGARSSNGSGLSNDALSKLDPVERMNAVRNAAAR